jgi:hypothetical protein
MGNIANSSPSGSARREWVKQMKFISTKHPDEVVRKEASRMLKVDHRVSEKSVLERLVLLNAAVMSVHGQFGSKAVSEDWIEKRGLPYMKDIIWKGVRKNDKTFSKGLNYLKNIEQKHYSKKIKENARIARNSIQGYVNAVKRSQD